MAMVIGTNVAAVNTNRHLTSSTNSLNSSLEKLSSGYRINTGKDDPSGLVISEQLRAQVTGLNRAVQNTNEANNVISIAEGALNEMNSILKTMKSLAIHSANNGVTSPEQVEADQAEVDSAIKTLERIANTTKFSDQLLLNGSKELTYSSNTNIVGTQNNSLLDVGSTEFTQIYKRDGYSVTIGFNGATNVSSTTNIGTADLSKQAAKAYLEIDTGANGLGQVDADGFLTQSQSFILTGSLGSRSYTFSAGTSVSEIVTQIGNYAGSTGIDASLVFNSDQTINISALSDATISEPSIITGFDGTQVVTYDNYKTDANGNTALIADATTTGGVTGLVFGKNTDGQGNIYVKVTGTNADGDLIYDMYKDASLSKESLIGSGVGDGALTSVEQNNSGLSGLVVDLSDDAAYGDVFYLNFANVLLDDNSASYTGIMGDGTSGTASFDATQSVAAGVELGTNTSDNGSIFIKVVTDDAGLSTVYAYKHEDMAESDLVAQSASDLDLSTATEAVVLNQIWNKEHTASTGLSMTLVIGDNGFEDAGTTTGKVTFDNLGARIYSSEYGSDEYIQVQQNEGALFTYYDQADKDSSATLIDAGGTGVTYRTYGQDATINVNGQQMKTDGLVLNLSTTDIKAKLVFNEGSVGSTTVAQVGYGAGSIFTGIGSLTYTDSTDATGAAGSSALMTQACHSTVETVSKFLGGMQLQLGEGSGDQNRTVVAIKNMSVSNLGQVDVTRAWGSSAVMETKTLSISDIQGGQLANLADEPELAMKIIEQAINDVSNVRAELGAIQANLLDTNANNLAVAVENITKTESAIRDTDMASQMTEYTKQQVLNQAGISMLSQANSQAQNVLSLLR